MSRRPMPLDSGEPFPSLELTVVGGGKTKIPAVGAGRYQVILFYRGLWCPYCRAQLTAFAKGIDQLSAEGIGVLAASVDPEEKAAAMIRELVLPFPVAHSLPVAATAEAVGAFVGKDPKFPSFLQSAGFVLGPDGHIIVSVYSSGPIGRLVWQDVLTLVQYLKKTRS